MAPTLVDFARELGTGTDLTEKPLEFYDMYDRYFAEFSGRPVTLLELGVYTGVSLKVWASYFRAARSSALTCAILGQISGHIQTLSTRSPTRPTAHGWKRFAGCTRLRVSISS